MAFGNKDTIRSGKDIADYLSQNSSQLVPARVINIDQSTTLSNGTILVELMGVNSTNQGSAGLSALPLFPNIKNYPLTNETVFLISLPSGEYSNTPGKTQYYYISPIKLWNSQHTNPTPNQYENIKGSNQNKSIEEVEAGSPNISTEQQTSKFKPGNYFTEESNIFPLYPFEGDIIVEGRFGNSIRLGSTNINYQSKTTKEIINKSFEKSYTYPSGEIGITADFISQLTLINNQVTSFSNQYPEYAISVYVVSSESQVTNPNNLAVGELARLRAQKLKETLQTFSNLQFNINISSKVGEIPYEIGKDNPNDPKYIQDQYSTVKVYLQAEEITEKPSQPTALNDWSNSPENGDPITIIRNGQSSSLTGSAQNLIIENINDDVSSIWLSSTQQIPITASSTNDYLSYSNSENVPEAVNQYIGSQVILNSGRLLFNTKEDHLMLSSAKSINLNAIEGIYTDTIGDTVFQSNRVYLGGTKNSQPIVLGDELVSLLTDVLNDLSSLTNSIQLQASMPAGSPLTIMGPIAQTIKTKIPGYQQRLKNTLSNTTKTV